MFVRLFVTFLLLSAAVPALATGADTALNPKTGSPYRKVDHDRLAREIATLVEERVQPLGDEQGEQMVKDYFCSLGPAVLYNHTTDDDRNAFFEGARKVFRAKYEFRAFKRGFDFTSCSRYEPMTLSHFLFGPLLTAKEVAESLEDLHEVMVHEYTRDKTHHRTSAALEVTPFGAGVMLMQRALQPDPVAAAEGVVLMVAFMSELRQAVELSLDVRKKGQSVLDESVSPVDANGSYSYAKLLGGQVLRIRILEFYQKMQIAYSNSPRAAFVYGLLDLGLLGLAATEGDPRLSYLSSALLYYRARRDNNIGNVLGAYWALADVTTFVPLPFIEEKPWMDFLLERRGGFPSLLVPEGQNTIAKTMERLDDSLDDIMDDYKEAIDDLFDDGDDYWEQVLAGRVLKELPPLYRGQLKNGFPLKGLS